MITYCTIPINPDDSPWWKYTLGDRVLFHNRDTKANSLKAPAEAWYQADRGTWRSRVVRNGVCEVRDVGRGTAADIIGKSYDHPLSDHERCGTTTGDQ